MMHCIRKKFLIGYTGFAALAITLLSIDPAYGQQTDNEYPHLGWIIDAAISRKQELRQHLRKHSFQTYTKSVSRNDRGAKDITLIYEFHSIHFLSENRSTKKNCGFRQAGTTGLVWNPGLITVYLDPTIVTGRSSVITPLEENTYNFYDYQFVGTMALGGKTVYEIAVKPRRTDVPLIDGTMLIAKDDYSIAGLVFTFNEATKLSGGVETISITQEFALFDEQYWLPIRQESTAYYKGQYYSEYRTSSRFLRTRQFGVSDNTIVVYDHKINEDVSFRTYLQDFEQLESKAENRELEYWSLRVDALTTMEQSAFIKMPSQYKSVADIENILNRR